MLAIFPLVSFLSLTLSMRTHNLCVINSGAYRVEHFTGVGMSRPSSDCDEVT